MTPCNFFGQTALVSVLLGGLMQPVLAQELIPTEEVGSIMGQYFCLETTGQLTPQETNSLVEQELVSLYGTELTLASMERLAVLDESTDAALDDPYAFEVLREMMRYAVDDDACFRATFLGS
jgi:hypothetical protein